MVNPYLRGPPFVCCSDNVSQFLLTYSIKKTSLYFFTEVLMSRFVISIGDATSLQASMHCLVNDVGSVRFNYFLFYLELIYMIRMVARIVVATTKTEIRNHAKEAGYPLVV